LISRTNSSLRPYVLVVEDDVFSRIHAVDLVEAAGYAAIEASMPMTPLPFWKCEKTSASFSPT